MHLFSVIRAICGHPLNRGRGVKSISRFIRWQVGVRVLPLGPSATTIIPFVNDTRLLASRGMSSATGNLYMGLYEFEDMAFVAHLLRPSDTFVDVGANVGTWTVLAAGVSGAKCIAFEPGPETFGTLLDNVNLNRIQDRVRSLNIGIGDEHGELRFVVGLGTQNHVATDSELASRSCRTIEVSVERLDDVLQDEEPYCIKIDVEGFESNVIAGASSVLTRASLNVVIMETLGHGSRYGVDDDDLHQQILGKGFGAFTYDPFKRELIPLASSDQLASNTLYVRDAQEVTERVRSAAAIRVRGTDV